MLGVREEVGVSDPVKRFRPKPFWQDGAPSRGGLSYRLAGNEQMFERHAVAWPPGSAATPTDLSSLTGSRWEL